MNIFTIGKRTATEELSLELGIELGLIKPVSNKCLYCNSSASIENNKIKHGLNSIIRCNNKNCRRRISIFKDSIVELFKLKLSSVIQLLYFYAMKLTITETSLHTNISSVAIVEWNKMIRGILVEKYDTLRENKIGGSG